MINIKHFNVDSAQIEINDVKRIEARDCFETDTGFWYREVQFVDKQGRCITLQLTADKKEDLSVKEVGGR